MPQLQIDPPPLRYVVGRLVIIRGNRISPVDISHDIRAAFFFTAKTLATPVIPADNIKRIIDFHRAVAKHCDAVFAEIFHGGLHTANELVVSRDGKNTVSRLHAAQCCPKVLVYHGPEVLVNNITGEENHVRIESVYHRDKFLQLRIADDNAKMDIRDKNNV